MADKQPKKEPSQEPTNPAQQPGQDEVTQQQNTALPGGRYMRPDGTVVDANNVPIKEEPGQPSPQRPEPPQE